MENWIVHTFHNDRMLISHSVCSLMVDENSLIWIDCEIKSHFMQTFNLKPLLGDFKNISTQLFMFELSSFCRIMCYYDKKKTETVC